MCIPDPQFSPRRLLNVGLTSAEQLRRPCSDGPVIPRMKCVFHYQVVDRFIQHDSFSTHVWKRPIVSEDQPSHARTIQRSVPYTGLIALVRVVLIGSHDFHCGCLGRMTVRASMASHHLPRYQVPLSLDMRTRHSNRLSSVNRSRLVCAEHLFPEMWIYGGFQ